MEFTLITPVFGAPEESGRADHLSLLRRLIENALDIADGLKLSLVGIHLDQALQTVDNEAGN